MSVPFHFCSSSTGGVGIIITIVVVLAGGVGRLQFSEVASSWCVMMMALFSVTSMQISNHLFHSLLLLGSDK